jgi:hypothetical protein
MKVALVHSTDGDWIGLYIDGKLVMEDHSLQESEVLEAVGIPVEKELWVELPTGHCPDKLEDVK